MSKEDLECSFCGRKKAETNLLIAGLDAHICDRCIEQAHGIVFEEALHSSSGELSKELMLKKPKSIKAFLDDYVIGQNQTKKNLSKNSLKVYKFGGEIFKKIEKEFVNSFLKKDNRKKIRKFFSSKDFLCL